MVFSAIVVIGIIVIYFLCQNSESKAVSQEVVQIRASLSYDRTGKLLILKSRTPNIRNVIKAEASHDINLTSVPDKLVYTGATVGGVWYRPPVPYQKASAAVSLLLRRRVRIPEKFLPHLPLSVPVLGGLYPACSRW